MYKNGKIDEKLMVEFDLDFFINDHYFYGKEPSQSEVINRHPLLAFFKKQMLGILIKHPLCENLTLVKYDCKSIKQLSFFLAYSHLKEFAFIAWQMAFLLPNGKPLTIKEALDYVIDYRKEKSLQKAVSQDYKEQIHTTKKYNFHYINSVCKYISDINIARRMVALKFENNLIENRSFAGVEKLFAYLSQTYTQKQIEQLMNDFSRQNVYLFFDTLGMLSQLDDEMMQKIPKPKPKAQEFHDVIVANHRILVDQKLFKINFKYTVAEQRGRVIKEPYTIKLPQNGIELYEWSVTLQNCLFGYGELIKSKQTTVYGFFKEGILHIAVEVNNNQIVQASSKYNQKLSREDTDLINTWFDELLKLTNSSHSDAIK